MAKLYLSLEGNSLGEFALDKERTTIGRRPTNDIHIDNLAVSGEHAVIVTIGNDSFLEDLNSTNGTLVNEKPMKKHVLSHDDIIKFGKYQLTYENKIQQKAPPSNGFENTVVVRPAKLVTASEMPSKAPTLDKVIIEKKLAQVATQAEEKKLSEIIKENLPKPSESQLSSVANEAPKSVFLEVLSGGDVGEMLTLNKAMTTLGGSGDAVAVITKRAHGYFITHVTGVNQPIVNGQSIGVQARALVDQDVIEVSGIKMKFLMR